MFIVVGVWISPVAVGALALGAGLGLRAAWWAVLLVVAGSGVLAVAAAMRIGAWYERRGAMVTASWPVQQQLRAEPAPAVFPAAGAPAIEQHVHLHYHAAPGAEVTTSSPSPTIDGRPASY